MLNIFTHGDVLSSAQDSNTDACWGEKLRQARSWMDWHRIDLYLEQQAMKTKRYRSQHQYDFQTCCGGTTEEQVCTYSYLFTTL